MFKRKFPFTQVISIFLIILLFISCNTYKTYKAVYYYYPTKHHDIVINDALKSFLAENKKPKFVLRTTGHSSVTGEDEASAELIYATIEKTLLKTGFTVRDRALLNQLLEQNKSYQEIAKKIDTDIIIEILSIQTKTKPIFEFTIPSKNYTGRFDDFRWESKKTSATYLPLRPVKQMYMQIKFKIVLIETGEYGGYMKLSYPSYINNDHSFYITLQEKKSTGEIRDDKYPKKCGLGWKESSALNCKYNSLRASYYTKSDPEIRQKVFERLTHHMLYQLGLYTDKY